MLSLATGADLPQHTRLCAHSPNPFPLLLRPLLAWTHQSTSRQFVAGTLLGYAIYVFSYMRTTNPALVGVCIGASVATMIATGMGAWGSLLKKHGVLKVRGDAQPEGLRDPAVPGLPPLRLPWGLRDAVLARCTFTSCC